MASFPITLQSAANLADPKYNIPPEKCFRSGATTIEGEKTVCVCIKRLNQPSQVVLVDTQNQSHITRKLTEQADAAIMHPSDSVIAVRGKTDDGHFIQIFNLETKERLGDNQFPEEVVFWKWANSKTLAVITKSTVFHWTIEQGVQNAPTKVFSRSGDLAKSNVQLINYSIDSEGKWCLLTGISTQDGRVIDGSMQLYSVERGKEQLLEGHAGCFSTLIVDDSKAPTGVFAFAERATGQTTSRLHIRDIYAPRGEGFKVMSEITYPAEAPNDFPVAMHISPKYGVLYLVTKGGWLFVFDASCGVLIFSHKISSDSVFLSAYDSRNGGLLAVNRKGLVLSATINEHTVLQYIRSSLSHLPSCEQIVLNLARRYGFPGCDEQLIQAFNQSFARGDYQSAARIAAVMKSGVLRTAQTIQQFKNVQRVGEQPSAILQYFSALLEHGKLNAIESVEIVKPVVAQQRVEFIEKWLQEDKLQCTEELGDLIKPLDSKLALRVYTGGEVHQKAVHCMMELGQYDDIVAYSRQSAYQTDYPFILRHTANVNPDAAAGFAKKLLEVEPPLIDVNVVIDIFSQQNRHQDITSILLEYLKANKADQGYLQTRLLEINLTHAPKVAEAIFQMELFSHYDRKRVAQLCEKSGLYQRALEHYSDPADVRRIIARTGGQLNADWLASYLGRLSPDAAVECLTDMLRANRQNLQMAVQMAIKYHERTGTKVLIEMFEKFDSAEGVFCFLGSILAMSQDAEVHFKYIEAAARLNHISEVERVCRDSQVYDPERVKTFLKEAKLSDPRPLIYVCDMHGYEAELAEYLYTNSLMKFIEVYVTRVNPLKAPVVLGRLIDLDCSEDLIKNILQSVRGGCPVASLVEEFEKRNRLRVLLPWLEARMSEGLQDTDLHNALAKIHIDTNRAPEEFLQNNTFYDSAVVGKYCEERDPHLAFTCYRRAWGSCDEQLVALSNKNGLFRLQARYLVERQSPELWAVVLDPDNRHRRQVIDQVVSTALPESNSSDEVSVAVKAFIQANLPQDLIELLEKIVLHNSDFSRNKNLQNLLLLTAMKADRTRVMDYINRLDQYDAWEIAGIALKEEYNMHEEALQIYRKFAYDAEAMKTLLDHIGSIERAAEFAARKSDPVLWSKLGHAQLRKDLVADAIESYLKAEDAEDYREVTDAALRHELHDELVKFLFMARKKVVVKDQMIDSELVYTLALSNRLPEVQTFIEGTNMANVQMIGDRLFKENRYEAAKLLFGSIPNHSRLASCHLKLDEYTQAVEAAKRANSPKTWKEVNVACVAAGQTVSAHTSGLHIIQHPDHLDELIGTYEAAGLFEELIALLEGGVNSERATAGLYTDLGVLYAKYKPQKLSDYIRSPNVTANRLNLPKLIRACENHQLWKDMVYLHMCYDEHDQAANAVMAHSAVAWTHEDYCKVLQKVSNIEILYRSITFYLDEHPMELNSLLACIVSKVDHSRVATQLRNAGHVELIVPYLQQIQSHNLAAVNDAINEYYLENDDYERLRASIAEFDNFDQLALAQRLETNELLEMRRLATFLYKKNRKYAQSVELSKKDKHFRDAMEGTRDSGNKQLVEDLLKYFTEEENKECFAACLFVCYELVSPHFALELAWRKGWTDIAMPFFIQTLQEYGNRITGLEKKLNEMEETAKKEKSAPNDFAPEYMVPQVPLLPGMNNLALMPPNSAQGSVAGSAGPWSDAYRRNENRAW